MICVAGLLVGIQTYPDAVIATGGACTPAGSDDCDGGALAAVDWGILVIFTCEALLKIVAFGLFRGPDAYLRVLFNWLDLVVSGGSARACRYF